MSLPIKTTTEDITAIVNYLRTKPTGATLTETKAVLKEVADARKITAFTFWGIVTKEGDRIKLASRGGDLARKTRSIDQVLREVLDSVVPYRSALEWMHHQKLKSVTNADVAAYWHSNHSKAVGSENENSIKDQAVCFMRVADAAGLGKFVLGRSGQPTRLDVVPEALEEYIEGGPTAMPLAENIADIEPAQDFDEENATPERNSSPEREMPLSRQLEPHRVFITHGKNMELVEQVETVLQVAEIEYEVAVKEETAAIPIPEKVFGAMRRCSAGIIIVSAEQVHGDSAAPQINPNVLIEIGAAFVLYDRKVVLLWEKGVPVPSNLQGLYRCEFEGKELGWSSGMKLMKAIKEFKK